ncbi:MAG: GWxTD domain-containing protein [Candidatus Marinimicrobia bacterium]|nr:GWxTD domain-containing protein [Candidatus Neomarinimicrobiota bacterium]
MKNHITLKIFLIIVGLFASMHGESMFGKSKRKNIDYFSVTAFPVVHESKDSVNILTFFSIPFTTLQFIKTTEGFVATYEATLNLRDNYGKQIERKTWQDTIVVDEYIQTTDRTISRVLHTLFTEKVGEYQLVGEVLDTETRYSGKHDIEINILNYDENVTLFPVIVLSEATGDFGVGEGWRPQLSNHKTYKNGGLNIFVSGRAQPGDYSIQMEITTLEKTTLWTESYTYTDSSTLFRKIILIPDSVLTGFKLNITTKLVQGKTRKRSELEISLPKPGISFQISDINEAIEQMTYILTHEERDSLKHIRRKDREPWFLSLWEKRDPTPHTVENELMDEYYKRVAFTNEHFSGFQAGWRSDQGMIYLLYGKPDNIERTVSEPRRVVYEFWYYYSINQKFIFKDENGFGDFRLNTPYFGYPN